MGLTDVEIDVIVNGMLVSITDALNYGVLEIDGFGMSPTRRLTQQGPMQHGETDVGFRLQKRLITMLIRGLGTDEASYWQARANLLALFAPSTSNTPVQLRLSYPPGQVRQIDCFFNTHLPLPTKTRWGFQQEDTIELVAPDPTWYDPNQVSVPFGQAIGGTGMAVPLVIPFTLAGSTMNQSILVNNAGSFITYPIITIVGPISNCVITNQTTGEKLDFTPNTIAGGVTYTVDCRYGQKTITDQASANKIATLTQASDLATFHLEPGGNSFLVNGSGIASPAQVLLRFYARYIGV